MDTPRELKPSSEYQPSAEFALMLVGEPFVGKTCLAFELLPPGFAVLNADLKLDAARQRIGNKPFFTLNPFLDANDKPLRPTQVFDNIVRLSNIALTSPHVSALLVDSMTRVADTLEAKLADLPGTGKDLIIGGEKAMSQSHWTPFKNLFKRYIGACRTFGKPVIFIFHERLVEDASGVNVIRPHIGGQLKDTISSMFTDSWRLFTKTVPTSKNAAGYARMVRTEPLYNLQQLGHSAPGLPAEFELDVNIIREHYPMLCSPSASSSLAS